MAGSSFSGSTNVKCPMPAWANDCATSPPNEPHPINVTRLRIRAIASVSKLRPWIQEGSARSMAWTRTRQACAATRCHSRCCRFLSRSWAGRTTTGGLGASSKAATACGHVSRTVTTIQKGIGSARRRYWSSIVNASGDSLNSSRTSSRVLGAPMGAWARGTNNAPSFVMGALGSPSTSRHGCNAVGFDPRSRLGCCVPRTSTLHAANTLVLLEGGVTRIPCVLAR